MNKCDIIFSDDIYNDKMIGSKIILNTIDNMLKIHIPDIKYYLPKHNLYDINIKQYKDIIIYTNYNIFIRYMYINKIHQMTFYIINTNTHIGYVCLDMTNFKCNENIIYSIDDNLKNKILINLDDIKKEPQNEVTFNTLIHVLNCKKIFKKYIHENIYILSYLDEINDLSNYKEIISLYSYQHDYTEQINKIKTNKIELLEDKINKLTSYVYLCFCAIFMLLIFNLIKH